MSLTQKQIYDLNNMNVASQNVALGTTLNSLIEGSGGGGGGDVVKIVYDEATMSAEDLGVAVKAVCDAGKIPAIGFSNSVYYCQTVYNEDGEFGGMFVYWDFDISEGALVFLAVAALYLVYTEGDGWTLQDAYQEMFGR